MRTVRINLGRDFWVGTSASHRLNLTIPQRGLVRRRRLGQAVGDDLWTGKGRRWVIETSYKLQLADNLSLAPDVQLLLNPSDNPGESRVQVLDLRIIVLL